jgi:DUF1680 family protein
MKNLISAMMISGLALASCAQSPSGSPHFRLRSLPAEDVKWTTGFWADRFETCHRKTIPAIRRSFNDPRNAGAQLGRLKFAAGQLKENPGGKHWADGDCYKWIETMAHVYEVRRDPALDREMDEWVAVIAKAQQDDGYISTNIGSDENKRFQSPHHHEMYNMGHLLTSACVHGRATGKGAFLSVACKLADYLYREYKADPGRLVNYPWNPSLHMGLVDLYRTTSDPRYLELVKIMIDNRGSSPTGRDHRKGGTDQTQDRMPLRRETMAVGHAVTGMYLYCGAADLYAETGEKALLDALKRIWSSVTLRKMDITGGVAYGHGTSPRGDPMHEAFGKDYQLPNQYNETCANIANGMFNLRMLRISGDAKYADIMEKAVFNSLTSAIDLKGENFFYCNPLKWPSATKNKHLTEERWFTHMCNCCPPQVARVTASLHTWVYDVSGEGLWVHLYGGNRLSTKLADGSPIELTQETDYPWDGRVRITIERAGAAPFAIRLRIPSWARASVLQVNGKDVAAEPGTYAAIRRAWKAGDRIELDMHMPVRLMQANPKVAALKNMVAVMRGPVVYCLELPKKQGGEKTWNEGVFLPENIEFLVEHKPNLLGGVTVLRGRALTHKGRAEFVKGLAPPPGPAGGEYLYKTFEPRKLKRPDRGLVDITLIPYYAWANRGPAMMEVWIPLAR